MGSKAWVRAALGLALIGGAAWLVWGRKPADAEPARKDAAAGRPIPVMAVAVEVRDVPIELEGLGSVTAFNTVTVRSQVDGRIERVAFQEGQQVKRGDLLVQLDARPYEIQLRQAKAALARDRAQLENARLTAERNLKLRQDKLIAQQDADNSQAVVAQLQAAVELDQAQIDDRALSLSYTRITAPIDGTTGLRLVDAGNLVKAGDPGGLVLITQLDPIAVLFTLPEDELPRVADALEHGPLEVEAESRDGGRRYAHGRVSMVDNQINAATGTIKLKAVFPNPEHTLWPNQFVKARLRLGLERGALVVPAAAVQRGPKGNYVYVVGGDGKALMRPLEVGFIAGELTTVKSGLSAGEQVVVEGQYRLAPGTAVELRTRTSSGSARPSRGAPR